MDLPIFDTVYTNIISCTNGNYSIDFQPIQVYRIDLPFFTCEVLVSRICGGECAGGTNHLCSLSADNKALTQVDSKLYTLSLWSQIM